MAELSPQAQVVLDAYGNQVGGSAAITGYERRGLAAALHAAAYQVVPARPSLDSCCEHWEQSIRHKLLAIAAELEATNG